MGNQQPTYNIVLKLPDGKKYEFNQATDFEYDSYENDVGRCKFSVPWNDPKINLALVDDAKFIQILIYRDNVLVWQGFVACVQDDLIKTTVYGLSLMECLKWDRVGFNVTYTGKKIGSELLSPIWDLSDAKANSILGDIIKKGTIENPYDTGTTDEKLVTKTVMDEDYFTLCQTMMAIARSNSPSGAWEQNTVFAISLDEASPTFSFLRNVGANKPQVIFELNSEIASFTHTRDYRFIRNDVKGLAVVTGPKVLTSTQTDGDSQGIYYLRQLGTVFDQLTSQGDLDEVTKDTLAESKEPTDDWYVSFVAGLAPFSGYVMGDNVKVRINHGRNVLDDFFRVTGMEVIVNNQGGEVTKPILRKVRA